MFRRQQSSSTFGLWEFLCMPFSLRNAGQTFQRLMDTVGAGLSFVFIYLDDMLKLARTRLPIWTT